MLGMSSTEKFYEESLALWRSRWKAARLGTAIRSKAFHMVKKRKAQLAELRSRKPAKKLDLSADGVKFIASHEGWSATPYNDPAGHATIGYGHLLHKGPVTPHDRIIWQRITRARGLTLMVEDSRKAREAVRSGVKVPLNQGEFDALVSFVYNVGAGAFYLSTLLKKLNAGDRAGAAREFDKWVKADGETLPGLVVRRRAERRTFLGQA